MNVGLGIIVLISVVILILLTHKSRSKYHKTGQTNKLNIYFHDEQNDLNENLELRKVGYWQKTSEKYYSVDTTYEINEIKSIIEKALNITENDFDIRTTSDLWVPHH